MRNPRIPSRPKTPCQIEKFTTLAVDKFTAKFTAPTAYHVNSENGFFCTPKIHDSLARPLRDYIYMCDAPEKEMHGARGGTTIWEYLGPGQANPCTTDSRGATCDPFMVNLGALTHGLHDNEWEIHHGDWNPPNNTVGNLFTLRAKEHRRLRRPPDL